MSHLAELYPYNKQLMIIRQPLLIPFSTAWSPILFMPFSQVKCSPDLWLTCGSSIWMDQVYYISKGSLKIANKQYTSVKNDYEMTLNGESTVIPCDDGCDVPMMQWDFVSIGDLENRDKDAILGKQKNSDLPRYFFTQPVSKKSVYEFPLLIQTLFWEEQCLQPYLQIQRHGIFSKIKYYFTVLKCNQPKSTQSAEVCYPHKRVGIQAVQVFWDYGLLITRWWPKCIYILNEWVK